jgi:hypothetical protein
MLRDCKVVLFRIVSLLHLNMAKKYELRFLEMIDGNDVFLIYGSTFTSGIEITFVFRNVNFLKTNTAS